MNSVPPRGTTAQRCSYAQTGCHQPGITPASGARCCPELLPHRRFRLSGPGSGSALTPSLLSKEPCVRVQRHQTGVHSQISAVINRHQGPPTTPTADLHPFVLPAAASSGRSSNKPAGAWAV
ncbi:hypothetical protein NDU88_002064 [Pleurodeles waltl]|uniref:Uncharacterized protein n=1 Tax=Pleurodeles waltl TaxID=8319 RepID=A0AAV7LNA5_PLEWA|nr:hypothetical protein NDU88_002064 [Pleurodeles waltl]